MARLSSSFEDMFGSIAPCLTITAIFTEPKIIPDDLVTCPDLSNFKIVELGAMTMSELHKFVEIILSISGVVANLV